ncbi:AAA family ATPase [Janibacter melonis]|uniref:AAA family ATPase n=1 Tax=Janibacter melonis TaxID=262209 RepID=UPI002095BABE|nr:ATP-binding protein [Janibacter melonis]
MTRIEYLRVDGLAGRSEPIEIYFHPRTNVIFGLNGTGKSSLLRILAAGLNSDVSTLEKLPFEAAEIRFWSHAFKDQITRRISRNDDREQLIRKETLFGSAGEPVEIEILEGSGVGSWRTIPERFTDRRFKSEFLSTFRLAEGFRSTARNGQLRTEDELNELFASQLQNAWRRYSSLSYSRINKIQSEALVEILSSFLSEPEKESKPIDPVTAYRRVQRFMRRQDSRMPQSRVEFTRSYKDDSKLRAAVARIDQIERQIEQAERPRKELQALVERFVTGPKHIEFAPGDISVRDDSGEVIDLARLSSGEKQLLRILVAGVDAERMVMIIDEPELSLHIDWQRELLDAVNTLTVETQVIVATHSPEIMATVPDDQIVML